MLDGISDLTNIFTGGLRLYKTYLDVTAPDVNYEVLKLNEGQKELEATSVLADIEQEADFIREQFNESVGSYTAMKARRGVKVGEGDVAQNIERSAIAQDKDVQTIKENARFKAEQLRAKSKQYKSGAKYQKEIKDWERVDDIIGGIDKVTKTFKTITNKKKKKVT